jgi:hypothetical protein
MSIRKDFYAGWILGTPDVPNAAITWETVKVMESNFISRELR